jgi:hypothetical protein
MWRQGCPIPIAGGGLPRGFNQAIRHAAHRRHDRDNSILARRVAHNLDNPGDAGGVADRSPAEFHHTEQRFSFPLGEARLREGAARKQPSRSAGGHTPKNYTPTMESERERKARMLRRIDGLKRESPSRKKERACLANRETAEGVRALESRKSRNQDVGARRAKAGDVVISGHRAADCSAHAVRSLRHAQKIRRQALLRHRINRRIGGGEASLRALTRIEFATTINAAH